jgi:hypothetical protein
MSEDPPKPPIDNRQRQRENESPCGGSSRHSGSAHGETDEETTSTKPSNITPSRKRRWAELQTLNVALPEPNSLSVAPAASQVDSPATNSSFVDYPRLRTTLDQELPFRAKYSQREAAQVIGTSDRSLRDWTRHGKIDCCYSPGGRPYYTPANLEDHFATCEYPRSREVTK